MRAELAGMPVVLKVGDPIRIKVRIIDGDGCDSPRVLIAEPGDVLQITKMDQFGVCARHHGYQGDHLGFHLGQHEYEPTACLCDRVKRKEPCWTVPIPVFALKGICSVCAHKPGCHKHTDKTAPGYCPSCAAKPGATHSVFCAYDPWPPRLHFF